MVEVVTSSPGSSGGTGAGFIVGVNDRAVYVVTAAHVVERREVKVLFATAARDSLPAEVVRQYDPLDVAVLEVPVATRHAVRSDLEFDRQGSVTSLRFGDPVYPVGCPERPCFGVPVSPDRFLALGQDTIRFQTTSVKGGSSGGALLNQEWEIVGMVITRRPLPQAEAIAIDTLLGLMRAWRLPAALGERTVPRAGYRTAIEYTQLGPTVSPREGEEWTWPSSRLALSRQLLKPLNWHAGVLRLTPTDMRLTAGVAGMSVNPLAGSRISGRLIAEVGAGVVDGRIPGRTYISPAGPEQTFSQEDEVSLGVGVGFMPEIAFGQLILHGLIGYWSFSGPEGVPNLSNWVYGGGFKIGFP